MRFGRRFFRLFEPPQEEKTCYSVYSNKAEFQRWARNSVMQVVRKQALGRVSCLFAISVQVPKLDVAGSIPVSRSTESIV